MLTMVSEKRRISIRAPARGATHGSDNGKGRAEFQSALPRGERQRVVTARSNNRNFNPRSREGSDSVAAALYFGLETFQSALPRGERHQFSPKSSLLS